MWQALSMTFTSLHLLINVYESSPLEEEPLEIIRICETVRASLSWPLVSSRLKILTTCTQDLFSSCVTIVCVTYQKNFLEPRFHVG